MPTVLIAEAERELREAYIQFLSSLGFEIHIAADGLECLSKLRRFLPDVLILDLELLWGGGEGVLAVMREDTRLLHQRVILTSAVASAHVLKRLASPLGLQALTKPFPLSNLLEVDLLASLDARRGPSNRTQRRGVLVVDDEPTIRKLLESHLRHQGFRVWTAGSGEDALDRCCAHGEEIAVVLLDVQMPGLDGPRTLDGIRALDVEIPVCFMTGDPDRYDPSDLLRRGARHLFRKPFRMDEVIRVVRSLANEPLKQMQEN
jgi:CheY-like chemotaxis protein